MCKTTAEQIRMMDIVTRCGLLLQAAAKEDNDVMTEIAMIIHSDSPTCCLFRMKAGRHSVLRNLTSFV